MKTQEVLKHMGAIKAREFRKEHPVMGWLAEAEPGCLMELDLSKALRKAAGANDLEFRAGQVLIHDDSGLPVTVMSFDADGDMVTVKFPDGRQGEYPGTAFRANDTPFLAGKAARSKDPDIDSTDFMRLVAATIVPGR